MSLPGKVWGSTQETGIDKLRAEFRLGLKLLRATRSNVRAAQALEDAAKEAVADSEYAFAVALAESGPIDRDGKRYSHTTDRDGLDRVEITVIPVSTYDHVQISGVPQ